jgi:threonine synthase
MHVLTTSLAAADIHAMNAQATFDDCQNIVKQSFQDEAFRDRVGA